MKNTHQKYLFSKSFQFYCVALFLFCSVAHSQNESQGIYQLPDGTFVSAIKTLDFKAAVKDQDLQRQDMWCWATCVAMALRFQHINVTQEDVVTKALNRLENIPGNGNDMVRGAYVNNDKNPHRIVDDLAYKYPLVVGINNPNSNIGHAYVLTAIYFTGDPNGNLNPIKVTLRDPWPYPQYENRPDKVPMSWEEFTNRVNTIVHITF
jgi:hypothetical protein